MVRRLFRNAENFLIGYVQDFFDKDYFVGIQMTLSDFDFRNGASCYIATVEL